MLTFFKKKNFNAVLIFLIFSLLLLSACSSKNQKYRLKESDCYYYNTNSEVFVKYPSEIKFSDKEFMVVENGKSKYIKGTPIDITISANIVNPSLNKDVVLSLYYTEDKSVCLASPLKLATDFKYFNVNNSNSNTVLLWIDTYNSYLVNIANTTPTVTKVFNDFINSEFNTADNLFPQDLIWSEVISVSPDGKYILFKSNRYYLDEDVKKTDLFVKNLETGEENKIFNFYKKDFIGWNRKSEDNAFLYREDLTESNTSRKKYSDIKSYALESNKDTVFVNILLEDTNYQFIDDEYFYSFLNQNTLNIMSIYDYKLFSLDTGKYSSVQDVKLSSNKDYIAFLGTYINSNGIAISEIVSIHCESNNSVSHTETSEDPYVVDSFYFGKDNMLVINFLNTTEPTKNKAQFYEINHKANELTDKEGA